MNPVLALALLAPGRGAVELTPDAAAKAVAAAKVTGTNGDLTLKLDYATKAAGAYPIVLVTYEIVCEKGNPSASLSLVKSFLTYTASADGQTAATKVGYAPLPDEVRTKVASTVASLS